MTRAAIYSQDQMIDALLSGKFLVLLISPFKLNIILLEIFSCATVQIL